MTIIENKRKTDDKFEFRNYYCCISQILYEALGYRKNDKISRAERNDIALIMSENKKWEKVDNPQRINTANFDEYGNQRAYRYIYEEDPVIKAREERLQKQQEKEKQNKVDNLNNITNQELDYDDYFMNL